jgi:hypothetical protein
MDFFKDPKYKSIRIVLLLVIIVVAGWFIMSNMNQSKSNQGSVINQTPTADRNGTTGGTPDGSVNKCPPKGTCVATNACSLGIPSWGGGCETTLCACTPPAGSGSQK